MSKGNEVTFGDRYLLVSKTDLKGKITYANKAFLEVAGYGEAELIGKPHNIIRHEDMPKLIFKRLWEELQAGREINAYVKNRTKNGGYYWVFANVTPSYNIYGKAIGYHSARRNPSKTARQVIEPLYRQLVDAERTGGVQKSEELFNKILAEKGVDYEEFVLSV